MKVTAFKDPETGDLFESETDYRRHLFEKKRAQATMKKREEAQAQLAFVRSTLVRELASKDQFAELAKKMYESAIGSFKPYAKYKPVSVVEVRTSAWKLQSGLRLTFDIEVELTAQPDRNLRNSWGRLAPPDVLYPFELWGSGSGRTLPNGHYVYCYGMQADVTKLPLYLATLQQVARLGTAAVEHESQVRKEIQREKTLDSTFNGLAGEEDEARAAFEEAQCRLSEVQAKRGARELHIAQVVANRMPFAQKTEYAEAVRKSGLASKEELARHVIEIERASADASVKVQE